MANEHLQAHEGLARLWEDLAGATLELTDEDILEVVRREGDDPDELARQARGRLLRAVARARRQEARRRRLSRWFTVPLDFCLADLTSRELRRPEVWKTLGIAFLLLPLLTAALTGLLLLAAGVSQPGWLFGMAAAALIAWTGTLACGASVSVIAASIGGIPLSVILGTAYGFLLRPVAGLDPTAAVGADALPVIVGLGGLPAILRPPWLVVSLIALAIAILSLAMAWVRRGVAGASGARPVLGILRAVLVSGLGPGVIFAINSLAPSYAAGEPLFALSLALVGGCAFAAASGLRSGSVSRALVLGLFYGAVVALVLLSRPLLDDPLERLLLSTTVYHVLLQGTFFALAYVLGERAAGPRGGAAASSLEGIGGYLGFLLARHGFGG